MTHFHEGQDVEVLERWQVGHMKPQAAWRKAKIVESHGAGPATKSGVYSVLFPDGSRDAFGAEQIRDPKAGKSMCEHASPAGSPRVRRNKGRYDC
jgi:hypothetical protein